ncbi:MAG: hypothetical protein AAGA30_21775, partial [Planctomycetota bacterium]
QEAEAKFNLAFPIFYRWFLRHISKTISAVLPASNISLEQLAAINQNSAPVGEQPSGINTAEKKLWIIESGKSKRLTRYIAFSDDQSPPVWTMPDMRKPELSHPSIFQWSLELLDQIENKATQQ